MLHPKPKPSSRNELLALGRNLRTKCPRSSHSLWKPATNRPSSLELVKRSDQGRIPELIPIRHGRMIQSPFTYYRGSAMSMAIDLARLPTTEVRTQICGDAHLGNFRCFATPERRIIFDIHDLDETLQAPWEWYVKRLAASFVVAARNNGLSESRAEECVLTCVRSYRERMVQFSEMRALELWYFSFEIEELLREIKDPDTQTQARTRLLAAKRQSALEHDFPKLATMFTGSPKIQDDPPLIYHWKDRDPAVFQNVVRDSFALYRSTLSDDRRRILDRFTFQDIAIKVVGVGSVGTFCAIILLTAGEGDPLFLQVKQANASVLEPYAGASVYENHGERVVQGHRLMQSASDLFLGWTKGREGRHFYIRQLRDAKIKFAIEAFRGPEMNLFARWCGGTLARAHARSGEAAVMAGYLGNSDKFDRAIASFSKKYADQVEKDHEALHTAARAGKLDVLIERN